MSKRELSECGLLLYLHSQWYVNEVTEMGWYIRIKRKYTRMKKDAESKRKSINFGLTQTQS